MYKIGASFDPENARMVDVSELHNLDYGFEAYATQAFNAPDGRALAVSWLGLPDVSYPSDRFDHQGTFSLVKELTIKDGKLYQYPVAAIKELRASKEEFSNRSETKNTYELELNLEANNQSEIILLADKDGKGLSINFDLVNGQVTVDRSQAGEQYAQEFGTTRSCLIDNQATTVISSSIIQSLKFSSIKEKKYFLVVSSLTKIKMESSLNLETQLELTTN